jgi:hypothetical protein
MVPTDSLASRHSHPCHLPILTPEAIQAAPLWLNHERTGEAVTATWHERIFWVSRTSLDVAWFLISWAGVRPSPLGTSATNWPIVAAPDDRLWVWSSRWNENCQEKQKYSEKTYPNATSSTTNPTWLDLGSNPGRRGGKPATNRLSYGTALDEVGIA